MGSANHYIIINNKNKEKSRKKVGREGRNKKKVGRRGKQEERNFFFHTNQPIKSTITATTTITITHLTPIPFIIQV